MRCLSVCASLFDAVVCDGCGLLCDVVWRVCCVCLCVLCVGVVCFRFFNVCLRVPSVIYCAMLCGVCVCVCVCLPLLFNAFVCFVFDVSCDVVWCVFVCAACV